MPNITYHLLTEAEPFSEFHGGAISRWAGNVLRNTSHSVVVCPSADDTWKFPPQSILLLAGLKLYQRWRRMLARLPWSLRCPVIRQIFRPVLDRVQPGDIVWIHNRPEFAIALTAWVHRAGGRVVLNMHNSHLVTGPRRLMRQVHVDRLVFLSKFLMEQALRKFPSLVSVSSVVYGGADETIFYPAAAGQRNAETPTVLFAGRLVEDKGVHILIDAMKLLSQTVHFFYRSGSALGDLFCAADIFCSPSVWEEGFGLVNVEAIASALPVVATHSGGVQEVLSGGGGILVERGSVVPACRCPATVGAGSGPPDAHGPGRLRRILRAFCLGAGTHPGPGNRENALRMIAF
jgi:spore coat protein SA